MEFSSVLSSKTHKLQTGHIVVTPHSVLNVVLWKETLFSQVCLVSLLLNVKRAIQVIVNQRIKGKIDIYIIYIKVIFYKN